MLLKLSCKVDIIQSLIHRWESWGMLKLRPHLVRCELGIQTQAVWAQSLDSHGSSATTGRRGHSHFDIEGLLVLSTLWLLRACERVCVCTHVCKGSCSQLGSFLDHPSGGRRVPMHLGLDLSNPTDLFSRVGFWNPLAGGGQRQLSGSFPTHTPRTFLLGANPHLVWFLLRRFHQPFRGDPDLYHTKGFNAHTSFRSHSMLRGRPGFTQGRQKAWLIKTSQGI